MEYLSGREAVRRAAAENGRMETEEGMIVFPAAGAVPRGSGRLPEFYPATPEEAFRMTESACFYADTYGTPVFVRLTEETGQGKMFLRAEKRSFPARRRQDIRRNPGTRRSVPERAFSDSSWNRSTGSGKKGIIVRGPAYLRLSEILNGFSGVRILKLGAVWPVPEEKIRDFISEVREILVIDETRDELLTHVYAVKGKYDLTCAVTPFFGEESRAEDLYPALRAFLGREAENRLLRIGMPPERSLSGMPVLLKAAEA